jgi:prepilin-type N-terminal cleavage/methylation domain-containing protein
MAKQARLHRGGFTLVELAAVMVVLAILAGTVTWSVRGHVSNARMESFLVRIEASDARARAEARRLNLPVLLGIDSSQERVWQVSAGTSGKRSFAVPRGLDIARLHSTNQQSALQALEITISPLGQSETYAMQVKASGGRATWLVVLGGSGQVLRFDREEDVEGVFSLQRDAIRNHAR